MQSSQGQPGGQEPISCSTCGLSNPPQARFCARCGSNMTTMPPRPLSDLPTAANRPPSTVPPIVDPRGTAQEIPTAPLLPQQPLQQPFVERRNTAPPLPEHIMSQRTVPATPLLPPQSPPRSSIVERRSTAPPRPGDPARRQTAPALPLTFPEKLVEIMWVRIPIFLRRYSMVLSEAWHDGIYMTAWPWLSLIIPALIFLFGFLQGSFHWDFGIQDGYVGSETFTGSLPLLLIAAIVGAFSAQFGLLLVLGYALGDFFVTGPQVVVYLTTYDNAFTEFLFLRIPLLVTYVLFFLLTVMPTLTAKFLLLGLRPFLKNRQIALVWLRIALMAVLQGAIVYAWTLSVPLYIRILWSWTDQSPPLSATYYAQSLKSLIIGVAVIASVIRGISAYRIEREPRIAQRIGRLMTGLHQADLRPAFTRRLPVVARALLLAAGMTLLFSGFIGSLVEVVIIFAFLSLILLARMVWLPRLTSWSAWTRLLARIPLLVRLVIGIFISYLLGHFLLSAAPNLPTLSDTNSGTFLWLLIGVCLSLLVFSVLVPQAAPAPVRTPALGQQSGGI